MSYGYPYGGVPPQQQAYPPYGVPQQQQHAYYQQQQQMQYPAQAGYAAAPYAAHGGVYPPAPAYYQGAYAAPVAPYAAAPYAAAPYVAAPPVVAPVNASAAVAAPSSVVAVVEEPLPAAPLSPISQARAREAAMVALNLAQAALPPPPAAAVQPLPPARSGAPGTTATAQEEEEDDKPDPSLIEMKLENAHYNLNEVLGANLVAHPYYRDLGKFSTMEEIVDEIYAEVKHVEPMVAGRDRLPSTAFFLLYKLFTFKLTKRQMNELLRHKDSPYIRAVGFLYLRCVLDPKGLWDWFEPYLNDSRMFVPGQQDQSEKSMGQFVRELLEKNEYYGMKMRRIPIPIQRDYQLKLIALDARQKRAERNEPYRAWIVKGLKLQAEYFQDSKFYEAVIDRVEEGTLGAPGKFIVTFLQYGNQEEVDIGALKIPEEIVQKVADAEEKKTSSSNSGSSRSVARERGGAPAPAASVPHRSSSSSSRDPERRHDSRDRSRDRDRDRSSSRHHSHRDSRSRSRSRSRDRKRSGRDRGSDRDRKRRSSRSPSSGSRDVFSDLPATSGGGRSVAAASSRARPRSPSPEVSLEALIRKDREASVAQGKEYARRPTSYKDSLSMSLISGSTRKRSRTPPVRRPDASAAALAPIEEAPRKPVMSEEAKAQRAALLARYGDAGAQKDTSGAKRGRTNDDEDVIRLGL